MVQCNPPTSVGVTLDHLYFPHIIDRIWDFMPYPSLVVSSKVNQRWHDQAGLRLRDHVAVFHYEGQPLVYRSRNVEYPEFSAPIYDNDSVSQYTYSDDIFEQMFYEASVYDAYSTCPRDAAQAGPPSSWPHCFNRIPDLRLGDWRDPDESEAMGHYIDDVCSDQVICFLEYRDGHFFAAPSGARYVDTLTLCIKCYNDPTEPLAALSGDLAGTLFMRVFPEFFRVAKLCIVLKDARNSDLPKASAASSCSCCPTLNNPGPFRRRDPDMSQHGALGVLLLPAAFMVDIMSLYVVGAEAFRQGAAWHAYFKSLGRSLGAVKTYRGNLPELRNYLYYCKHQEFRTEVRERTYLLMTVQ